MTSINPWLSPNAGGFGGPQQRQQLGPQLQPVQPQSPSAYTPNPALGQMANSITQQATSAFNRQVMPGVRNEASAMGQYGGSRQGVVEANAMKDLNQGIANSLAGLYYGDYNNQMNRNLAQYQGDQSYNLGLQGQNNQFALGMGNLGLGYGQLDAQRQANANQYALGLGNLGLGYQNSGQNFALGMGNLGLGYTQAGMNYGLGLGNQALQRQSIANSYDLGLRGVDFNYANLERQINNDNVSNQLAGAQFGLGVYDRLMTGNNQALAAGNAIQNTPLNYYGQFANQANSIGQGYGTTATTASAQGNPWLGAVGGAQLGSALGKNLGFGS